MIEQEDALDQSSNGRESERAERHGSFVRSGDYNGPADSGPSIGSLEEIERAERRRLIRLRKWRIKQRSRRNGPDKAA